MATLDPASAMAQQISALRNALTQAQANVGSTWSLWGTGSSKDAAVNALAQDAKYIDQLDTQRRDVLAGTKTYESWTSFASDVFSDIQTADSSVGSWSFSNIVVNTTVATASDVKKDVEIGAAISLPLIVAGAVVYLLFMTGMFARH